MIILFCIASKKNPCALGLSLCCLMSGINDQGLYRVVGVSSKVQKLLTLMIGESECVLFICF